MFRKRKNSANRQSGNTHRCQWYKDLFIRGLNQFLQFYKGTQLVSFKVSFCLGRDSACDIDRWVSFAVTKDVEQLCLNFSCVKCHLADSRHRYRRNELYIFRPVLLYLGGVSKLKLFSLHSCLLGPDFQSILFRCLNLESLTLGECCLPVKLCISGSHLRLKSLKISDCCGMKRINLSATSLTSFEYYGDTVKFSFSTPNMEKVLLGAKDGRGVHYIFSKLAIELPWVKNLSIIAGTNWVKRLPKHISWFYPFRKAEQLRLLFPQKTHFDIHKMIAIIRAFPLLRTFHLVTQCPENYEQGGIPVPTECVHKFLLEVEIGGFYGTCNQVEFAIYLLKYARALQRMVIDPYFFSYIGKGHHSSKMRMSWFEGDCEKLRERLQEYSKSAVITNR